MVKQKDEQQRYKGSSSLNAPRSKARAFALACLLFCAGAPNPVFGKTWTADEIIDTCIQNREAIPFGDVSVILHVYRDYRGDQSQPSFSDSFQFRFSGSKIRIDASESTIVKDPDGKSRATKYTRILVCDSRETMDFTHGVGIPDGSFSFRSTDRTTWGFRFLPEGLGMSAFPYHSQDRARVLLGSAEFNAGKAVVDEVHLEGERLLKVSGCEYVFTAPAASGPGERQMHCNVTVWFDPQKDMALKQMEIIRNPGGHSSTLVNSLKLYNQSIWYPHRSVLTNQRLDGQSSRQEYVVESASFAEEPDGELFTLAGMHLPAGTPMAKRPGQARPPGPGFVWDGAEILPFEEWEARSLGRPRLAPETSWVFPTSAAVIIAAVGAYFVYRRYIAARYA